MYSHTHNRIYNGYSTVLLLLFIIIITYINTGRKNNMYAKEIQSSTLHSTPTVDIQISCICVCFIEIYLLSVNVTTFELRSQCLAIRLIFLSMQTNLVDLLLLLAFFHLRERNFVLNFEKLCLFFA